MSKTNSKLSPTAMEENENTETRNKCCSYVKTYFADDQEIDSVFIILLLDYASLYLAL